MALVRSGGRLEDTVTLVVQVDSKVRAKPRSRQPGRAGALASHEVPTADAGALDGREVVKEIVRRRSS
jgi:hypothetical protein